MSKKQVCHTNNSGAQNLSRHALLKWVNSTIKGNYKKVENLGSGEAYCMMLELLHPNCVGIKKIKKGATQEYQFLANLKLFQDGLVRVHCDQQVPIVRLAKCKFQDNLEFLQWFRKYYDSELESKQKIASAAVIESQSLEPSPEGDETSEAVAEQEAISARFLRLQKLQIEKKKLEEHTKVAEKTRDFYRNKCRKIDELLKNSDNPLVKTMIEAIAKHDKRDSDQSENENK